MGSKEDFIFLCTTFPSSINERKLRSDLLGESRLSSLDSFAVPEQSDSREVNNFKSAQDRAAEEQRHDSTEANNQIHEAESHVSSILQHGRRCVVHVDEDRRFVDFLLADDLAHLSCVINARATR